MAESATPVKLFGKWALDEVEISDLSLVVSQSSNKVFLRGPDHFYAAFRYQSSSVVHILR